MSIQGKTALVGLGVTDCATAKLRACASRRSTLKSSSRKGSRLSHGDALSERAKLGRLREELEAL